MSNEFSEACLDYLLIETVNQQNESSSPSAPENSYYKLENIGFKVGLSLSERYTSGTLNGSASSGARFLDQLDIVKFICKDFWLLVFKKQIDNLKTNHRGVYVLTDNSFKWFSRMSTDNSQETSRQAFQYLAFPCGLMRGALTNLGVNCVVVAEVTNFPQCTFQIKIKQ